VLLSFTTVLLTVYLLMLSVAQSTYRQSVQRMVQNSLENMRNVVVAQFVVILQCLCEGTEKTMKSFSIPGLGVDN
jgi:hypothetical protein